MGLIKCLNACPSQRGRQGMTIEWQKTRHLAGRPGGGGKVRLRATICASLGREGGEMTEMTAWEGEFQAISYIAFNTVYFLYKLLIPPSQSRNVSGWSPWPPVVVYKLHKLLIPLLLSRNAFKLVTMAVHRRWNPPRQLGVPHGDPNRPPIGTVATTRPWHVDGRRLLLGFEETNGNSWVLQNIRSTTGDIGKWFDRRVWSW